MTPFNMHHLWGGKLLSVDEIDAAVGTKDYIAKSVALYIEEVLLPEIKEQNREVKYIAVAISMFCEDVKENG